MPIAVADIAAGLGPAAHRFDIEVLPSCDSTNALALRRAEAGAPSGLVIVAEEQTAGRGRRGRSWFAHPGDSLTFSLFWRFAPGTAPAGLSLAVGVAVARALENAMSDAAGGDGAEGPRLKWPNDILMRGRKLGGILVELLSDAAHAAVIGIGVNLRLPAGMPEDVRAASAAMAEPGAAIDAAAVLAAVLRELLATLEIFAAGGFAAIRAEWLARHAFQDIPVRLTTEFASPREGICRGVDSDGALLLEVDGRLERILSGEVSLRPV